MMQSTVLTEYTYSNDNVLTEREQNKQTQASLADKNNEVRF